MNILVIGSGGREHAVIKAIKKNPAVETVYCLPGNGGIAADATCVNIGAKDIEGIVKFASENPVDYAIVTPDDPLVLGCVDALTAVGIPCFGPDKKAAIIEGSKAFSKDLMKKYGIPTAASRSSTIWTRPSLTCRTRTCPSSSRPTAWLWVRASSSLRPWVRPRRPSAP